MLKGICTTVAAPLLSVVTGTVQDASTGEAVIGAAVILQNTTGPSPMPTAASLLIM